MMLDWASEVRDELPGDANLARNNAPVREFAGCQRVENSSQPDRVILGSGEAVRTGVAEDCSQLKVCLASVSSNI